MKINYDKTALRFLENPKDVAIHTPDEYQKPMTREEDLRLLNGLIDQFCEPGFRNHFNKNIQLITVPFYNAYQKAADKLRPIVPTIEINQSGTLIIPWPQHTQTIFYMVNSGKDDGGEWIYEVFLCMFTAHSKSDSFALDLLTWMSKDKKEVMDFYWKGFQDEGRDSAWFICDIMLFLTFLKYAEVETKIVNGKKKQHHCGQDYHNETNKRIEILDSTYFTTISRTEGFGVSGHFRFQPWGPGRTQKRLQWISDYQKEGYTKRAKILTTTH